MRKHYLSKRPFTSLKIIVSMIIGLIVINPAAYGAMKTSASVGGLIIGDVSVLPNPFNPTISRVPAGVFRAANDPNALHWVEADRSGVLFKINVAPELISSPVHAEIGIYGNDIFLGPLISATNDNFYSSYEKSGDSAHIQVYWNGFNKQGYPVKPGVYSVKIKIEADGEKWESSTKAFALDSGGGAYMDSTTGELVRPKKSGCGQGFVLAFFPPFFFRVRRSLKKRNLALRE